MLLLFTLATIALESSMPTTAIDPFIEAPPPGTWLTAGFTNGGAPGGDPPDVVLDHEAFMGWARRLEVTETELALALTAGSEVTTTHPRRMREHKLIMRTVLERMPLSGFRSGFPGRPDSAFAIITSPASTTGRYGEEGREYSSSRIAAGRTLAYFVTLARQVIAEHAAGISAGGVVSFCHKTPGQLAILKRKRAGKYEVVVELPLENGKIAAFWAPTAEKLAALNRAAARARGRR